MEKPYTQKRTQRWVAALVLVLVSAEVGFGQQPPSPTNVGATQLAATQAKSTVTKDRSSNRPAAGHEGISVHGHWVIEIRNPDGRLVQHREFENALAPNSGAILLVKFLGGFMIAGDYALSFSGIPTTCAGTDCVIVTSLSTLEGEYCKAQPSNSCLAGLSISFPNDESLQLAGQTTATQAGEISAVQTILAGCVDQTGAGISSANCRTTSADAEVATGSAPLTATTISPISVLAGQQISFTVIISFS